MKIASIERILEVKKHAGADKLFLLYVLGYQLVTAETYNVGDLCIFVHPDSVLPEKPEFEFLRSKKFRVDRIRLRGEWSQGLALPISILPPSNYYEGQEVSEIIDCRHYEKPTPVSLAGEVRGNFPSWLIKTDEALLKSYPELVNEFDGVEVYLGIKIDGSSFSAAKYENELWVCSRNLAFKDAAGNTFWNMARKYNLQRLPEGFSVQCECFGNGVQKNPLGIAGQELATFNVFNIAERKFLGLKDAQEFCANLEIPFVTICNQFKFDKNIHTIEYLQSIADKLTYPNGKISEGIVIRPIEQVFSTVLRGRLSAKIISMNYKD